MAIVDNVIACDGYFSEVITVDGDTIYGVVCYTPENYDYPVVIYEDSCCDMTILGLDDIAAIYCLNGNPDDMPPGCCATAPAANPILYAHLTDAGNCECLTGTTIALIYQTIRGFWTGGVVTCNDCGVIVSVYCGQQWLVQVFYKDSTCLAGMAGPKDLDTCSPFSLTFPAVELSVGDCGCGCTGLVDIVVNTSSS